MSELKISDLQLIKIMGEGSTGSVKALRIPDGLNKSHPWRAIAGKVIAVKSIQRKMEFQYEKEKRNLEALAPIKCSAVMKFYGTTCNQDFYFLLLEFGKCGSLYDNMSELLEAPQKTIIKNIRTMMWHVTLGLMNIHKHSLVHCDLKPGNIVLRSKMTYECFIADFGSMYRIGRDEVPNYIASRKYAAPEQISGRYGLTKSDIWATGLTFVVVSIGKELFSEDVKKDDIYKSISDGSLIKRIQSVSFLFREPVVADLLLGMLEMDPATRFTAEEAHNHPFVQNKPFIRSKRKKPMGRSLEASKMSKQKASVGTRSQGNNTDKTRSQLDEPKHPTTNPVFKTKKPETKKSSGNQRISKGLITSGKQKKASGGNTSSTLGGSFEVSTSASPSSKAKMSQKAASKVPSKDPALDKIGKYTDPHKISKSTSSEQAQRTKIVASRDQKKESPKALRKLA